MPEAASRIKEACLTDIERLEDQRTRWFDTEEDLRFRFRFLTFASLDVSERSRLRVSDRRERII